MNVLMLGVGKGSFAVRGVQLGAALGARVRTSPEPDDLAWADVVVLIKRAGVLFSDAVHAARKPIVWDALDFWQQPEQNGWPTDLAYESLCQHIDRIQPVFAVGATRQMADDAGGHYLPHHARPGLEPAPVRDVVTTVAYEGTKKYLGQWGRAVESECARRGWAFVINPPDLSVADLLVAFRDGAWDGWMCQAWKSGVKYVNAIRVGRPIITQTCAAWMEIKPAGAAIYAPEELSAAFDDWSDLERRRAASYQARDAYALTNIARDYRGILERAA